MFGYDYSSKIQCQYAPFIKDPVIRKLLIEIRNRDLNMHRCLLVMPPGDDPTDEWHVVYASNKRPMVATRLVPLSEFCQAISSASRFEQIEARVKILKREKHQLNKRQDKAKAKASRSDKTLYDGMISNDGLERVQRGVYGVPVAAWVKPGERASFLSEQRKRIRDTHGRMSDSEDSEDTEEDLNE